MFQSIYMFLLYVYVLCTAIVLISGIVENRKSIGNKYYIVFVNICTLLGIISFVILVLMVLIGVIGGWIG